MRSIDCIVVQRRMLLYDLKKRRTSEVRRIVEIAEIEEGANPIFSFDTKKDQLVNRNLDDVIEKMAEKLGSAEARIRDELRKRERYLQSIDRKFNGFYAAVQKDFYGITSGEGKNETD